MLSPDDGLDLTANDWLVTAGHIDCFALEPHVLDAPGRRRPLFTVSQGGVLFRIAPDRDVPRLIAMPSLGARWEALAGPATSAQRDGWARRLLGACVSVAPDQTNRSDPAGAQRLTAGTRLAFGRQTTVLRVSVGVVRLGGIVAWGANDGPLLALEPLWLETEGDAAIVCAPPEDDTGLAGLHRFALSAIGQSLDERTAQEFSRQAVRSDREADALHGSLQLLVAPAGGSRTFTSPPPGTEPVIIAVDAVLAAIAMPPLAQPPAASVEETLIAARVRYRRVLLRPGWQARGMEPFVAYLGDARLPVAILPEGRGWRIVGAHVDEPLDDTTAPLLQLDAVQIYRALPADATGFAAMLRLGLVGGRSDISRAIGMALLAALAALALPSALALVFDTLLPTGDAAGLTVLLAALCVAALAYGGFAITNAIALLRIETRFEINASPALMDRLLRLPPGFFRSYTVGDLVDRLLGIQNARALLSNNLALLSSGLIFALASLLLLFSYDWRVSVVAALLSGAIAGATLSISRRKRRLAAANLAETGRLDGFVLQLIVGVAKLRAAAAEGRAMATWARRFAGIAGRSARIRRLTALQHVLDGALPPIAVALLYLTIARTGPLTTGDVVTILAAFAQTLAALMLLARAANEIAQAAPLIERARPLLETAPETPPKAEPVGRLEGHIALRGVSFRYGDGAPLAVDDVTLDIPAGAFVAFVGASGSGKSTLLRLLLGFDRPTRGEVLFDGRVAERLDTFGLRRQIGVVLQHGQIFSGSILQNILGPARVDISEAWAAARMVGLDRDIEDMPMGMHTVLLDGGGTISGGQRQRILIARALVHRPRILLFDEATSALDNRTQAIVTNTLGRMAITRVVIAHRLSTIVNVDRIFVIDRGRIVQEGGYDDLLARPGPFADLARRQMIEV